MSEQLVDLAFRVLGAMPLPADHGYALFAAIAREVPTIHDSHGIGIHPIRGRLVGARAMQLCPFSRLTIRIAAQHIPALLPLAGKQLDVAGRHLRVGVPCVQALLPVDALRSRLVTIKVASARHESSSPPEPEAFLSAVRRQLAALDVSSTAQLMLGKRRTLRIQDKEVVGYELVIENLTADESLVLQSQGVGGRRHMGCGIFVPGRRVTGSQPPVAGLSRWT